MKKSLKLISLLNINLTKYEKPISYNIEKLNLKGCYFNQTKVTAFSMYTHNQIQIHLV